MPPPPYLEQGCGGPLALTTQEVMQACQGVGEVRGGHQQHGIVQQMLQPVIREGQGQGIRDLQPVIREGQG